MYRLFTIILILFSSKALAQSDTIYYDRDRLECDAQSATSFDVIQRVSDSDYFAAMYIGRPYRLHQTIHYKTLEPPVYQGEVVYYYMNGDTVHGWYDKNMYTGEQRAYYDKETEDTLQAILHLKGGKLHGNLVSYYRNGKVKRRARYANDMPVLAHQYDENGNEIDYTPFMTMPLPPYDINKYLATHIRYPMKARRENIQGRVMIRFVVDKTGKIRDAIATSKTDELLNREALRVVHKMRDWKPGIYDDEPTDVYFTLPVLFKLE